MELVNLYTRQHENSLHELNAKGFMTNKKLYVDLHMGDIAPFFSRKYDKFVEMAEKRLKRPSGVEYPIWCSVSKENCLKAVEKSVVYCLQVPKDQVIYFSSIKWDYVLNNLYIPINEDDEKAFEKKIKELGCKDRFNFIDGKYKGMYPNIEREIIDSWERIFDIDVWDCFKVQANLWQIKKEWVKHIIYPGDDFFKITADMTDDMLKHNPNYKEWYSEKIISNFASLCIIVHGLQYKTNRRV